MSTFSPERVLTRPVSGRPLWKEGWLAAALWLLAGRVYLACTAGLGLVHSLDVEALARQIDQGRWTPREVLAADLPGAYGFVPSPQAAAGPLPA